MAEAGGMNRCPMARANLPVLTIHIMRHTQAFTKKHFQSSLRMQMNAMAVPNHFNFKAASGAIGKAWQALKCRKLKSAIQCFASSALLCTNVVSG